VIPRFASRRRYWVATAALLLVAIVITACQSVGGRVNLGGPAFFTAPAPSISVPAFQPAPAVEPSTTTIAQPAYTSQTPDLSAPLTNQQEAMPREATSFTTTQSRATSQVQFQNTCSHGQ